MDAYIDTMDARSKDGTETCTASDVLTYAVPPSEPPLEGGALKVYELGERLITAANLASELEQACDAHRDRIRELVAHIRWRTTRSGHHADFQLAESPKLRVGNFTAFLHEDLRTAPFMKSVCMPRHEVILADNVYAEGYVHTFPPEPHAIAPRRTELVSCAHDVFSMPVATSEKTERDAEMHAFQACLDAAVAYVRVKEQELAALQHHVHTGEEMQRNRHHSD